MKVYHVNKNSTIEYNYLNSRIIQISICCAKSTNVETNTCEFRATEKKCERSTGHKECLLNMVRIQTITDIKCSAEILKQFTVQLILNKSRDNYNIYCIM